MRTRSGKLFLNSLYSLAGWLAPIVLGLFATPFVLKHLGVESYGVYIVILGFVGYSFAFNLSRSVAKFVAEYRGSGNVEKINSVITSAFWLNCSIGLLGAVVVGLSAKWVVVDVLQISPQYQEAATFALIVGGISIPITLVGQVFQSILQGEQGFGALSVITNLSSLLINGGNVALAAMGFGVDALLLWTLVVAVIIGGLSYLASSRLAPDIGVKLNASTDMIRPVMSYGASLFVYQVCGGILLLFERALVIRKFGGEVASFYFVPMTLAIYFHGFVVSLLAAAFPVMNELLADEGRLAVLYEKSTKVVIALTVPFLVTVFFGGPVFLSLWIDQEFAKNASWLFFLHAATFGVMVLILAAWQLNETFNKPSLNAWATFFSSAIAILLMFLTADRWRAEGVAMSRLIGVAVMLPIVLYSERRFLSKFGGSSWLAAFLRVLPSAAVLVLMEYALFRFVPAGWATFIVGTSACTLIYGASLLITKFITDDEKIIILRFLKVKRVAA
ncbi:MAG TPA: oligosaccharide flippase family protein [Pyrinomonadaceae bacterium]|nr:oligosaccharide flippase family protein [Pyrinomonadaceae bacterium]